MKNGLDNKFYESLFSTFPEYLHTSNEEETIKATPRSWERISKSYSYYKDNKDSIPSRILFNVLKGNVGTKIAQEEFINLLRTIMEPLISYE